MKKHVVTGPIRHLSQCHPTITNSYSYSWIWNQMFLLIHFEIQELWVIITTNTRSQPENFQEILQISRRFPGFPGGKIIPVDFQECYTPCHIGEQGGSDLSISVAFSWTTKMGWDQHVMNHCTKLSLVIIAPTHRRMARLSSSRRFTIPQSYPPQY